MDTQRIIQLFLIFALGFISDFCWSLWHKATSEKKAITSANWSVGIILSGLLYIKAVSDSDWTAVVIYIIGAWLGMFVPIHFSKKEQK